MTTSTARALTMLIASGSALSAAGQSVDFRTDNGSKELQYTLLNEESLFGNYYSSDEAVQISRVEFAPGFGLEGSPYEVLIYNDPDNDGNPVNAELLSRTVAIVGPQMVPEGGLFVESIGIDPIEVEGGFFVAIWIKDQLPFQGLVGYNGSWYTAPSARRLPGMHQSASWAVRPPLPSNGMGGVGSLDIVDLGNNLQVEQTQLNWVIRAFGREGSGTLTSPHGSAADGSHNLSTCAADVNLDGQVTASDFFSWVAAFNIRAPACDQNGDTRCDSSDFFAWVTSFTTGCSSEGR